jgi:thiosulfate/3-mercaptopyruvate sulfurtransferase
MVLILALLALLAATNVQPMVSTEWLEAHLSDPNVRVIYVGSAGDYNHGHIAGARVMNHMETVQMGAAGHRLAPIDALVRAFTKAGVADGTHVVLYGDRPMEIGWVNSALIAIGHGADVSWLNGGMESWRAEKRHVETSTPQAGSGPLTARPGPDVFVDAAWMRSHLDSPATKILDVRTEREWNDGHLPNASLILWQDLFADRAMGKFKSPEEIKMVLARAGVKPDQEVVTYCAVGMRASLMAWAARSAGIPARIYIGSWQDWSSDSRNPIVK